MSGERVFLWLSGVGFLACGVAFVVAPISTIGLTELSAPTDMAVIEVRGYYGGQLLGLGGLMVLGALRTELAMAALLAFAASLGGTGLGRLCGLVAADTSPPFMTAAMVAEIAMAGLALLLASRGRSRLGYG